MCMYLNTMVVLLILCLVTMVMGSEYDRETSVREGVRDCGPLVTR